MTSDGDFPCISSGQRCVQSSVKSLSAAGAHFLPPESLLLELLGRDIAAGGHAMQLFRVLAGYVSTSLGLHLHEWVGVAKGFCCWPIYHTQAYIRIALT